MTTSPSVRLDVHADGRAVLDAPAGWVEGYQLASLRAAFDRVRPELARVAAPPLPPRAEWPPAWSEAWLERVAIASECGDVADPAGVAAADLRAAVARGEAGGG